MFLTNTTTATHVIAQLNTRLSTYSIVKVGAFNAAECSAPLGTKIILGFVLLLVDNSACT
jgi:hypothetical protein